MTLLESLQEVLQAFSLHDRVEVLHGHTESVVCHSVLSGTVKQICILRTGQLT